MEPLRRTAAARVAEGGSVSRAETHAPGPVSRYTGSSLGSGKRHVMCAAPKSSRAAPTLAPRILVVGRHGPTRRLIVDTLPQAGYIAEAVDDGAQALVRLHAEPFAAVLLDPDLPGISGLELLPGLRVAWPETPVLLLARPGTCTSVGGQERDVPSHLSLPLTREGVLNAVRRVVRPWAPCPACARPTELTGNLGSTGEFRG